MPPALTSEDTSGAPESRPSPTGLQVQSISLGYHPARPVIENLTAAITPGAVTMIVGPNACGKSTLLRSLSRILSPGSGQVILDGRNIATMSPKQLARRVGLNECYLKRHFRQRTGLGIAAFVRQQRMACALALLESGPCAVQDVARHVGYQSLGHFARAFRAAHGCLPSDVRAN